MTPTQRTAEGIEGRPYKDYAYSPVPESSSSAVIDETNPPQDYHRSNDNNERRGSIDRDDKANNPEMTEKGSKVLQYVAAAVANLCVVAAGAMLGWTSPILPKLEKNEDSPLGEPISEDEGSWVGSLVAMGAIYGSFTAGYLAERWGRKKSLLFCVLPFMIGWILVGTAAHLAQLYVARLIFGFALAFPFTVVPMYVGEIAETSIRGALGSFLQLFITVGLLYSYSIGPYVSYLAFWIICACLPILFFVTFLFMPESPYYLLSKGEKHQAIAALAKLRGKTPAGVQKEADEMQAAVEEAFREQVTISDLFKVKANFKALIYTCALASFQQLTGINVVLFYMEKIFIAANTTLDTSICTIIVGVVQTLASMVTPLVVDRLGRRMLLLLSGIGEIVTLGALGLYFYLQKYDSESAASISWLPVVALVIFISTYSVGWGPLPWAVMGEMFASNVKSKASGVTVCVCWLLAFFITKFTSNIEAAFGLYTTFWGFGVFCILSVLFTVFILPETKGKNLQQIQDELNGVKPSMQQFDGVESSPKK